MQAKRPYSNLRPNGLKWRLVVTKGEQTREMILHQAATVFNLRGYFGASMADIMQATGLEKGGIYNHFQSKDDLALQAFDYAVDLMREQYAAAIKGRFNAIDRLNAVIEAFGGMAAGSPLPGGCPVINTATEADDAHPALRERAREAMQEWVDFIRRIVQRGIERGEIKPEVSADQVASVLFAMLEGAIIVTRLAADPSHMERMLEHIHMYLETSLRV